MSWSYSGNPASSPRDLLRFTIGDTMAADPQFTDEELDSILAEQTSNMLAAIDCCERLIAHYARLASQTVGAISVQYRERGDNYRELLRRFSASFPPTVYAGGISVADKEAQGEDEDWDQPAIKLGMDKRP